MPVFSWNERKRLVNLRKHGFDFRDAAEIFAGVTCTAEDRLGRYGECRWLTAGVLRGVVVVVAHTETDEEIRIISIRKATRHEARAYFAEVTY